MAINLNGIVYSTLGSLNNALDSLGLTDIQKECIRNDFNGVVNAPLQLSSQEQALKNLEAAQAYGLFLIKQYQAENVILGITSASKTKAVSDYLSKVTKYCSEGSLYAAIEELTAISNDLTLGLQGLSPHVTSARAKLYRGYIQTFLGIPVTP